MPTIIALHWSEWLRRVEVDSFNAPSAVAVEDFLQRELDNDRTAFVFDVTDRPMVQAIAAQWGNGRFSNSKLVEIYNALVGSDESRHVRKFKDRDTAFAQIAVQLTNMARETVPRNITTEDNMTDKNQSAQDELEGAATDVVTDNTHVTDAAGNAVDTTGAAAAQEPALTKEEVAARKKAEKEAEKAAAKAKRDAEKAEAAAKKAAEKEAAKAAKPKGVIAHLIELLTDGSKRTVDELYDKLAAAHPERGEGMKTTIRVQLVRLGKEGRLVVHSEDRVDSEGKKLAGKNYWGTPVPTKEATTGA